MTKLIPHLSFSGNAARAADFSHAIFGGECTRVRFAESHLMAGMAQDHPDAGKIMHAELVSGRIRFMLADVISGAGPGARSGRNNAMAFVGPERELLSGWGERLSEGGTVIMPLAKQVWGDVYGAVTDRFGISWMVNIDTGGTADAQSA